MSGGAQRPSCVLYHSMLLAHTGPIKRISQTFTSLLIYQPFLRVTTKVVEVELASGSGTQRQWNSGTSEFHCARTPAHHPALAPGKPGRY